MAPPARTLPFPRLNKVTGHDGADHDTAFDHRLTSVVVVVGRATDDGELLRAAHRANAVTLFAPDIKTAQVWLGLQDVPVPHAASRDGVIALDGLVVDLRSHEARWNGAPLDLTTLELRLLAVLAEEPGTAWSFTALSGRVWGSKYPRDRSMVRSAIYRLRRKLASAGVTSRIIAVRGVGFRFLHPLFG